MTVSKRKLYAMQLIRMPKEEQESICQTPSLLFCTEGDFPKGASHTIFAGVSGVGRMQSVWSKDV